MLSWIRIRTGKGKEREVCMGKVLRTLLDYVGKKGWCGGLVGLYNISSQSNPTRLDLRSIKEHTKPKRGVSSTSRCEEVFIHRLTSQLDEWIRRVLDMDGDIE